MNKAISILLAALVAISCNNSKTPAQPPEKPVTTEDSIARLNIQFNDFSEIDSSGILMLPLAMREEASREKDYYKEVSSGGAWNILFYNSHSKEYHLLTKNKILIENNYSDEPNIYAGESKISPNHIFYIARTEDYNNDKVIDTDDPAYLFSTDRKGYDLRQLSPSGYNLGYWRYIQHTNKVVLSVNVDKNGNKEFEPTEDVLFFETRLDTVSSPVQIFSKAFLDSVKINFGNHWHKLK